MPTTQRMPEAAAMLKTHGRVFKDLLNGRNLDVLPTLVTQDYAYHGPGGLELRGADQLREMIQGYFRAFPDLHMAVGHRLMEGDLISTHWIATGTHEGPLGEIPPTGNRMEISGQVIMRFEGAKIAEEWEVFDEMWMLKQLGAIPD